MSQGTGEAISSFPGNPCFRAYKSKVICFANTTGSKSAAQSKSLEFSDFDFSQAC